LLIPRYTNLAGFPAASASFVQTGAVEAACPYVKARANLTMRARPAIEEPNEG
jgi:hypothetical protein